MDGDKRELLLAGNSRGSVITRKEAGADGQWRNRSVNNFAPRCFSSIGTPDETLGSRTISIPLIATTDRAKSQLWPARQEHWPHELRSMIEDLWLCAVVHLNRVSECDAKASDLSKLHARGHDIWRMPLAIAYWLQHDHGVAGVFDRVTAISMAYQKQVQDIQGVHLIGLVLTTLFNLAFRSGKRETPITTAELLELVQQEASASDQESEDVKSLTVTRLGQLVGRLGFTKGRSHGRKRSWTVTVEQVKTIAAARSHKLPEPEAELEDKALPMLQESGEISVLPFKKRSQGAVETPTEEDGWDG